MTESEQQIVERFRKYGQEHVFRFVDELSESERESLFQQVASIDLEEVEQLVQKYVKGDGELHLDFNKMEPSAYIPHYERVPEQKDRWLEAKSLGEKALREGKVATFTVAGGQGTRLGFDGPKGTFPVTPVTKSTLFEVFAKKIAFTGKYYGAPVHWLVMTSIVNHEQTVAFFEEHQYFGLDPDQVHIFKQGLMPAVDFEGKLILGSKSSLAMAPDGHGGSLRAQRNSGMVAMMKEKGIEMISYFQVDNPLVRCLDPYFIGFHVQGRSEMSSKMIPKTYPLEKVGHFCDYEGRMMVVEYSDLPTKFQEQVTETGELRFLAGSIAIHIFDVNFVEKLGGSDTSFHLPFHKAEKKIPYVDEAGDIVKPESPNGVKFEMFVFDALPFAENPVLIETLRDEDFSPVKNAEGNDSPATCHRDQLRMFAKWLKRVGMEVPCDDAGVPTFDFEIDPGFACDSDSFIEAWNQLDSKPEITTGTVLKG